MVRSASLRLLASTMALILLLSDEALGLSPTFTKFAAPSQYRISSQRLHRGGSSIAKRVGGKYNSQSNTRLTSAYIEARHISQSSILLSLPSVIKRRARRFMRNLIQRKSKRSLVIGTSSIILALIIMFGPAFSPAAYAAEEIAAATSATVAGGLSPATTVPFATRSRALGSWNILPTKAEVELCFRLLYAACAGGFVGLERSSSDRPAGIRTMALVGMGACIYTMCSIHGFIPSTTLGHAPGSPQLANVKVDLSRMAANIASGVGFIGAGAIHKSKLHGNGTEEQNIVAGLTTAAAIWVSAGVGIASATGMYSVAAFATFSTVAILKYARVPSKEEEHDFEFKPRDLEIVDDEDTDVGHRGTRSIRQEYTKKKHQEPISGLFGVSGYDPESQAFVDHEILPQRSTESPIFKDVLIDPKYESKVLNKLGITKDDVVREVAAAHRNSKKSNVLIEEEQEVIAYNATNEEESSVEP